LDDLKVGQRVVCAGGGFAVHAEYVLVPRNLLAEFPDHVDYESAAFSTLGAIALHGFRLSQSQLGERVAVIGLGLLGLLTVGIANAAGCQVLGIDLDPYRVDLAKAMDAEAVLRDEAEEMALTFSQGRGCDTVLICADTTSSDPVELAGIIARDRAHVVATGAVGLEIPRKIYYEKELSFVNSRSYGPGRYDPTYEEKGKDYPIGYVRWTEGRNLEAFVDLLATNRLDVKSLITHRFPIS
jgi:threonine dehydrogenase-like Zn-dependent dehydrogenase